MKNWYLNYSLLAVLAITLIFSSCKSEPEDDNKPTETDFTDHLSNQVNEVIIPTMIAYQSKLGELVGAVDEFVASTDEANLTNLRSAYQAAYLSYQAAAVHNYFATANQALVITTNLFPVDISLLETLIQAEAYNFGTSAQERANGFPALDYMLYGPDDVLAYYTEDAKRLAFLKALVDFMKEKSDVLVDQWSGNLKTNFIENGGTALGSSLSVQLNESLLYCEDHIRENKVGIPIGQLGPNDSPISPDPTKIEGYYQSLFDGNESFTLALLQASIEEMEDIYLGETASGTDAQGYDDLLAARDQSSVDTDIKAQYAAIYEEISKRNSISGDQMLYNQIQEMITLYKSDLFPLLNIQDADGLNDGD
jgi:hypothetical protein